MEEIDWTDEQLDLQAAFAKVRVAIAACNAATFNAQCFSDPSSPVSSNNQNNTYNNLTNANVEANFTPTTAANSNSPSGGSYSNSTTTLNHSSQEQQQIIGGQRQTSSVSTLGIYNLLPLNIFSFDFYSSFLLYVISFKYDFNNCFFFPIMI